MKRVPPDRMDKAYDCALDYMKAGTKAEEGHQAAFRYDILPKLAKIKQPTLVIYGTGDKLLPYYKATLEYIPHAQGHIIEGADGRVLRLFPREWAETALEFLKQTV